MTEINIPDDALRPKLFPATFDRTAIAREIITFIQTHGRPYLCPILTHSTPPKNVPIEYFGQIITLPEKYVGPDNRDRWAPCPCCRPRAPKFYKNIMLVYFPREQVIRAVGHECFKNFNEQYHDDAWKRYQEEQKRKSTLLYLAANIDKVPEMISQTEHNLPIVDAFDTFRFQLAGVIDDLCGEELWGHVRGGQLPIERKTKRLSVSRTGDTTEQEYVVREHYGPVVGYEAIRPRNTSKLGGRLRNALKGFTIVNIGNGGLNAISPEHREEALRIFSRSIRQFREVKQKVEEMIQFTGRVNLSTLSGWGKHAGAPMTLFVDMDGRNFYIGHQDNNVRRIIVPEHYGRNLRDLPAISDVAAQVA